MFFSIRKRVPAWQQDLEALGREVEALMDLPLQVARLLQENGEAWAGVSTLEALDYLIFELRCYGEFEIIRIGSSQEYPVEVSFSLPGHALAA